MKSFAFQQSWPVLKELNAYSEEIITDTRSTISPPPQKEFSITGISGNVVFWFNCGCWVPSMTERQNIDTASEVLRPENGRYHYIILYVTSIHLKNHLEAA